VTTPTLTPDILADDDKLHQAIDTLLTENQTYWRHCRAIYRLQARHQELASEDALVAHLEVEQGLEARHAWELALVARGFWEAGRKHGSSDDS
jgi:hypothetical protein